MKLNLQVQLYPNESMKQYLKAQCDYRRYCWNKALEVWDIFYSQRFISLPTELKTKIKESITNKKIQFTEEEMNLRFLFPAPNERNVRNELVANKSDWEYTNSSRVLQLAVKDLADAWSRFFTEAQDNTGKPKFKSRKDLEQGFKTDRAYIKNNSLVLDKPREYKGYWGSIKFRGYNVPDGKIKLCTVTCVKGHYIANLTVEVDVNPMDKTGKHTAVDANVNRFEYTEGTCTLKSKDLNKLYDNVKHYQRKLNIKRKINGENAKNLKSYQRTRIKLQSTYSRIRNIQNDILHKFTTMLYKEYDIVVIEDLSVKGMQMSKKQKDYIDLFLEDFVDLWNIKR